MRSSTLCKISILTILYIACNLSIGQNYSTEEIPSPYSSVSRAELYSGSDNSLNIIGISGIGISGVYDTTKLSLFIINRDENGFTNDYNVIDTGENIGYGFGGSTNIFNLSVDKNQSGKLLVAWTKQNISFGDIANYPMYFKAPVLKIGTWSENTFVKIYEFPNEENPQIKSDSINFHLVRQSVSPIKTQYFESDSNYYYTTSKILYNKIFSNGTIDSTIHIGNGFFPKIHVDKNKNINFLWLAADSSNSKYFQLMYRKKTLTNLEPAILIKDSVRGQWDEDYNVHDYPTDYFSYVDDSGRVYAGWTDHNDDANGKIFFSRLLLDNTIRIESLDDSRLSDSDAYFKVTPSGVVHALWRTTTLCYSQTITNDSLFSDIRSYQPLFGAYGHYIIYLNDNNIADGILQLHSTVGYFKDLLNGEDTTLVIAKWSLAYGFNLPRQLNAPTKSFTVDQSGQMWLLSKRASESVKLVKFDLLPTSLESKNIYLENFSLSQNYPNPFNPLTNIRFFIPKTEFVEINIFNIAGQNIKSYGKNKYMSGTHQITFDGSIFASGIYFVQMKAGNFTDVKKMVLVK